MQKITRDQLIAKASELLQNGTVSCVLGWGAGEFGYDVTPTLFKNVEELEKGFVFHDFCGANFSKYLIKETQNTASKVLCFLKPCDTYSFNQLLTEHRIHRENAYVIGVPCNGMADIHSIRKTYQTKHRCKSVSMDKSFLCKEVAFKETAFFYFKTNSLIHISCHNIHYIRQLFFFKIFDIFCTLGNISKNQTR